MIDLYALLVTAIYEAGVTFVCNHTDVVHDSRDLVVRKWTVGAFNAMESRTLDADDTWQLWDSLNGQSVAGGTRSPLQLLGDEAAGDAFDRLQAKLGAAGATGRRREES